jgi:hypothetical protein
MTVTLARALVALVPTGMLFTGSIALFVRGTIGSHFRWLRRMGTPTTAGES